MITQRIVTLAIDNADLQYQRCWDTLSKVKLLDTKRSFGSEFLDFQPLLCQALLQLEKTYHTIAKEKERLIQRKSDLSEMWFNRRMKTLGRYQEAIEKCIYIGKALGDSFAWIFYENEMPLLVEHLKHEELSHLPSGIGAAGELAFVKEAQGFGKCLIIYHGITTFLRLGDVSFFDFSSRRIVDLGELKTRKIDEEHLGVTVVFAGWRPEKPSMSIEQTQGISKKNDVSPTQPLLADLPSKMKDRLGRQLKNMAISLNQRNKKPDNEKSTSAGLHIEELTQLYSKLKVSSFVFQKVGPGLLLMGYRNRPQSLSAKLLGKSRTNLEKMLREVKANIYSILDQTRSDNLIYNGMFYYDIHGRAFSLLGTIPLFWWPLDLEFIKAVMFQDVIIFTIFNPLHFIKKLENTGWLVEHNGETEEYTVTRMNNGSGSQLENFGYFIKLIQNYLFKEEGVVEVINNTYATITEEGLQANTRVEIHLQQVFGIDPKLVGYTPPADST
jgi:hypothetical protein